MEAWIQETYDKILKKERKVVERNQHIIPYTTKDNRFVDKSENEICWWTNGFWGGMLWQLYVATKDELYKQCALETEKKLD